MNYLSWLVGREEDQFEESAITGRTHGDDPTLTAVVLLSNAENVASGMEDVGVRDAVLTSARSDLHRVKVSLTRCSVKGNLTLCRSSFAVRDMPVAVRDPW